MEIKVDRVSTDVALWDIERYLMQKYGTDAAQSDMAPLRWYVETGRASVDFIRKLMIAKPFMVARKLHEGGSYDEALDRVKKLIKWGD